MNLQWWGFAIDGFNSVLITLGVLFALQVLYYIFGGGVPGTTWYFTRRMRDPRAFIRRENVVELMERGDAFAKQVLVGAIDDTEPTIRGLAVEALALTGDPALIAMIIGCLKDPHEAVRLKAANSLARIATPEVAQAMKELLRSPDVRLQFVGLRFFKDYRDPEAVPALAALTLEAEESMLTTAIQVLSAYGDSALASLARLIPSAGENVRNVLRAMLDINRVNAYEHLCEAFAATVDGEIHREILWVFSRQLFQDSGRFLVDFVGMPNFPSRESVLETLPFLADASIFLTLAKNLSDPDLRLRRRVESALDGMVERLNIQDLIEPLCEALIAPDQEMRIYASKTLGRLGGRLIQQRTMDVLWGEKAADVATFLEGVTGYNISRMINFDAIMLAVDRLLTNNRPSREALKGVDFLSSLLIVLYRDAIRGWRLDDYTCEMLVRGRRSVYPLRLEKIHPLAVDLLQWVTTRAEGDRWRTGSTS